MAGLGLPGLRFPRWASSQDSGSSPALRAGVAASAAELSLPLPRWFRLLRGCLEAGLESLLKATGGNLLILRISHCPNVLTDRSLWLASCYCRALQAVTYRYVHESWAHRTSPWGTRWREAGGLPAAQSVCMGRAVAWDLGA